MSPEIKSFELLGKGILKRVVVSNFGASIMSIEVQDRYGDIRDVALGFSKPEDYKTNPAFFGVVVGPIANRTKDAKFNLDGKTYEMEVNENGNNLHFNFTTGLHLRTFESEASSERVVFKLHINDMEDGLPGDRDLSISYEIDNDALKITYNITSDKDTVFNSTNHNYYNLNGHSSGAVYGHSLKINADYYTDIDSELIPTGKLLPTKGSDYDYAQFEDFSAKSAPIDHNFCRNNSESFGVAAELMSLKSGIHMKVATDLPGIQVYTGGSIPNIDGKDFAKYSAFSGIALETQFYPNSVNEGQINKDFKMPLVKGGKPFTTITTYEFKTC